MIKLMLAAMILLSSSSFAETYSLSSGDVSIKSEKVRYTSNLTSAEVKPPVTAEVSTAVKPEAKSLVTAEVSPPVKLVAKAQEKAEVKADQGSLGLYMWDIRKGETLRGGLKRWIAKAGWNYLAWQSKKEFPVVVDIKVNGTFQEAISQVLKAYHRSGNPLYGCLKKGNRVVVIADTPLNDKCYSNNVTTKRAGN